MCCRFVAIPPQHLNAESFCLQEAANDKTQANTAGTADVPPLLNAMVHSQQSCQDQSFDSPVAGFLIHSSSLSPLKSSELEVSSPSHPLFLHTSVQQQSPRISLKSPAGLQASPRSSQQSPASLLRQQVQGEQPQVRFWKSLRPESRATLDGSSDLPTRLQGKSVISPAPLAGNRSLQAHAFAARDSEGLKKTTVDVQHSLLQGRAESLEGPWQTAPRLSHLLVQGVRSSTAQGSRLAPAHTGPLHTASDLGSSSQHVGNQGSVTAECSLADAQHSSSHHVTTLDEAANMTNSSHGRCSHDCFRNADWFVGDSSEDAGSGLSSSSAPAIGTQSSTVRPGSSATDSCAECSSTDNRASFPFMIGCQPAEAGAAAGSHLSTCKELGLLSALNSADLAYLSPDPSGLLLAGNDAESLCSSMAGIKGSKQVVSKSAVCAVAEAAAMLEGSSSGEILPRNRSIAARSPQAMHTHGGPGNHAELIQPLGNADVVLIGSDCETQSEKHSNSSVAAAAHAQHGYDVAEVKPADNGDNDRQICQRSGLNCGHTSELSAMHASCDSLYDDNDWEG